MTLALMAGVAAEVSAGDPPASPVEKELHSGKLAEGETALWVALDARPDDDEVRFGLGLLQFLRAVENLGRCLHEYGAVTDNSSTPFLRLPAPKNDHPSTISYRALGRVLDGFVTDLARAEKTLAAIKDDRVKLRVRLANIPFDFTGRGDRPTTLVDILARINGGGRFAVQQKNPELRFHFDRGDVAWLRAYGHLLSAMVEGYRSVDEEHGFRERVGFIFPSIETRPDVSQPDWRKGLRLTDPPRLRRMRLHFLAVAELNRETWKHIRAETDDDFEWLPHPKQTDPLGMPPTSGQIDAWLSMMEQWEGLMSGDRLLYHPALHPAYPRDGLNVRKVLDDPPADLFSLDRLTNKGIDAKYLEPMKGRKEFDLGAIFAVLSEFNSPFGWMQAARMN